METTFQNIAEIVEKKIETSNKDIFISDLFTDLGQFSKIDQFREILREYPEIHNESCDKGLLGYPW